LPIFSSHVCIRGRSYVQGNNRRGCDLSMDFPQILGKNRGCALYSGATCSPENTVPTSLHSK